MSTLSRIAKKYVGISNDLTSAYENSDVYNFLCDLYFPKNAPNPNSDGVYTDVNIFGANQSPEYADTPDVKKAPFVIPHLLKRTNMNSPEDEFDAIYEESDDSRPFIETSKSRELPYQTKVVVYIEKTKMFFSVDNKTVVNGADGHMLLRQYLSPLEAK